MTRTSLPAALFCIDFPLSATAMFVYTLADDLFPIRLPRTASIHHRVRLSPYFYLYNSTSSVRYISVLLILLR